MNILPITQARGKLGDLAKKVSGGDYVVLTKGGVPEAALVDYNYLLKLEKASKQFIPKLISILNWQSLPDFFPIKRLTNGEKKTSCKKTVFRFERNFYGG